MYANIVGENIKILEIKQNSENKYAFIFKEEIVTFKKTSLRNMHIRARSVVFSIFSIIFYLIHVGKYISFYFIHSSFCLCSFWADIIFNNCVVCGLTS